MDSMVQAGKRHASNGLRRSSAESERLTARPAAEITGDQPQDSGDRRVISSSFADFSDHERTGLCA